MVALRSRGITEVLFDLNFALEVGYPDVDAAAAREHAKRVIESLAPAALQ